MNGKTLERFLAKIPAGATTDCVLWQGALTTRSKNYGAFWINGKVDYAHRAAFVLFVGPIPEDMTVDHKCDTPRCVNPMHLELATNTANILRGNGASARNARKTHCKWGHPLSGDNMGIGVDGARLCRACKRRRAAETKQRKRAAELPPALRP